MLKMNVHETKTHLSRLLEQIEKGGEDVIIARHGKPIARLIPYVEEVIPKRQAGSLAGKINIPDNFDSPLPDDIASSLGIL